MTIGENIKIIRKEKRLTQKALGELCGISESNIRKYENGKQNPKLSTLEKIADALNVSVMDLLEPYVKDWAEASEFNNFIQFIEELGYRIVLAEDHTKYYLSNNKDKVILKPHELNALIRQSSATVNALIQEVIYQKKQETAKEIFPTSE